MRNVKIEDIVTKIDNLIKLAISISEKEPSPNEYRGLSIEFGNGVASFLVNKDYNKDKLYDHLSAISHSFKIRFTSWSLHFSIVVIKVNGSSYTLLSCTFSEFFHCCGKIIGHTLHLYDKKEPVPVTTDLQLFSRGKVHVIKDSKEGDIKKIDLLNCYFDIARDFLVISPYTSMSVIVSVENGKLFTLFPKLKRFTLTNEFINQRMSIKNVCQEYVFNLDY